MGQISIVAIWWCVMVVLVAGEAGLQWASGRWNTITDSNQEESRKQDEGQAPGGVWMDTFAQRRCICSATSFHKCDSFKPRKTELCAKQPKIKQKKQTKNRFFCTIQGEAQRVLAAPLISSLYLNNKFSVFCAFDSACLSSYFNL